MLSMTVIGPGTDVASGGRRDRVIHRAPPDHRAPVADWCRLVCQAFSAGERLSVRWRRAPRRTVLADTVTDSWSPIPGRRLRGAAVS